MQAELVRHQLDNMASEEMRHARNDPRALGASLHLTSSARPPPQPGHLQPNQQLQVTDNTRYEPTPLSAEAVRRDARRGNLGAGRGGTGRGNGRGPGVRQTIAGRAPPPRSNGQFRRMDKPGTQYKDISSAGRQVLADEYDIPDEPAYNVVAERPCVICTKLNRNVDHCTNRCLGISGTTEHCEGITGADNAAKKRRDFLGINALSQIRDSYDDTTVPTHDRHALERYLDCVFESSPTLMHLDTMYECADDMEEPMIALAVSEFDRAHNQCREDTRLLF